MRAIRIHGHGGPDVLKLEEVDPRPPGPGEVMVRNHAVGVNFTDIQHRRGEHRRKVEFPAGVGQEGAGVIEAVGEGVEGLATGDRVAYATLPPDSYAEARVLAAERVVKLPDGVDFESAAGMLLKGMTVDFLTRRCYPVKAGDAVLFHAAAGGVGLIACQWLKHIGATVIGTAGSREKAERARASGCDHAIVYTEEDVAARVADITGGEGVAVVYDSVGQATFRGSLASLAPRGYLVCFGAASGPIPPFAPADLGAKSLFMTWARLPAYTARRADLVESARRVFAAQMAGMIAVDITQRFALAEAAEAHRAIETRTTTGSTILLP